MEKYLKMSDVFEVGVVESDHVVSISVDCLNDQWRGDCSPNEYAAHAINSHDELVAEVERLTKSAELAIMTLEEVDRVLTERIKNGAYDLYDISGEVTYTLDRLSHRE